MMPLAEIAHHTTSSGESHFFSNSFRIFCFPYLSILPVFSSRQMKNSFVAEPNVVRDGWFVFVAVEQRFTHFLPAVINFFFEFMYSLQLLGKSLNIFA